jgi:hypothetical protein
VFGLTPTHQYIITEEELIKILKLKDEDFAGKVFYAESVRSHPYQGEIEHHCSKLSRCQLQDTGEKPNESDCKGCQYWCRGSDFQSEREKVLDELEQWLESYLNTGYEGSADELKDIKKQIGKLKKAGEP